MALPIVSAEFWVALDPDLTFQPNGDAKLRLRLKAQDRTFNRDTKEWENGKELWVNATCWRKQAENVADSIVKGDNVVVSGKLSTNEWTDKNQNKRESLELDILEIGPSLRFRTTPHGASAGGQASRSEDRVAVSTGAGTPTPQNADGEPSF